MDEASRLQQHDNVQQQISAFEKLLQHAINRFSKEKLFQKLRTLTRVVDRSPAYDEGTTAGLPPGGRLSSLRQLRHTLDRADSGTFSELGAEEEKQLLTYFQRFFGDIDYLRRLKQQFDVKIYRCLYEYYYDPERDSTEDDDVGDDTNSDAPVRHGSSSTQDLGPVDVAFDTRSDEQKLSYAVRELYNVNTKWDDLFREEHLHMESFDPDSYHEIVQFSQYSKFEPLLRLVPDIFVRAYKSVELAKIWWTASNKVYGFLPREHASASEYESSVEQLRTDIAQMAAEIRNQEALLASLARNLRMLRTRENRCNVLGGEFDNVETLKNRASQQYSDLLERRRRVLERLKSLDRGTAAYRSTQMDVRKLDGQLDTARHQLEELSFKFDIIKQDFSLELELRPEFIRYVADVKEKMSEAEDIVAEVRDRKRTNEKRLALVRTNCERMRQIMTRYLHAASPGVHTDGRDGGAAVNGGPTPACRRQLSSAAEDYGNPHSSWDHTAGVAPLCTSTRDGCRESSSPISRVSFSTDSNGDVKSCSLPGKEIVSNQFPRETLDTNESDPAHVNHHSPTSRRAVVRRKRGKRST